MSDLSIIEVEGVSKCYRLGAASQKNERYTALRDVLAQKARGVFQRRRAKNNGSGDSADSQEFWALKDVSFSVQRGEVVGIIGRNGAGKSTLLKILSRITEPTEGIIKLRGRIASLLEVGTGFHPELTGRENIFLNGAILGMHRAEIIKKFDEIVAFAEVERFLDTPVKRYSSGMYVRLAFAVAAHLEPEILVVDEVLAVGDVQFQKKCLGKMQDVAVSEHRTVLFVSHQMAAIENMCQEVIVLGGGRVVYSGGTRHGIDLYLSNGGNDAVLSDLTTLKRKGNGEILLTAFGVEALDETPQTSVASGQDVVLAFRYRVPKGSTPKNVNLGFSLHQLSGETLTILYSDYTGIIFGDVPQEGVFRCKLRNLPFSPGRYLVSALVITNGYTADWPDGFVGSVDVEGGDFYKNGCIGAYGFGPFLIKGDWTVS